MRGFKIVKDNMRKTTEDIIMPCRSTSKSMGYDFYANKDYTVKPNDVVKIWTDIKAYMGDDECLILNIRSSQGGKFILNNIAGWIDADYFENENNDGNIGIFLKNVSDDIQYIRKGDKIAQGAFFSFLLADDDTAQGIRKGGFGSTN